MTKLPYQKKERSDRDLGINEEQLKQALDEKRIMQADYKLVEATLKRPKLSWERIATDIRWPGAWGTALRDRVLGIIREALKEL